MTHDKFLLDSATKIVANSKWTSRFFKGMLGYQQIEVVHDWTQVDPDLTTNIQKYQGHRLACLNTFDLNKDHKTLLEAAALLKKTWCII